MKPFLPTLLAIGRLSAQGPAGHWPFDGATPDERLETSNQNPALKADQIEGNSSWSTRSGFGEILANGSTPPYLALPNSSQIAPGNRDFSISLWFRRTSGSGSTAGIIDALSGIGTGFQLFFQTDNTIRIRLDDDANHVVIADTTASHFSLDTWRHCYLAVDRINQRASIFIDGLEASPDGGIDISTLTGSLTPDQTWWIGTLNGSTPAHGQIDDLAIFQRLLTPNEIGQLSSGQPIRELFPPAPKPAEVEISPPSGILPLGSLINLSIDPSQDIRYTLDGTDPTLESPLYSTAIPFIESGEIRARGFLDGIAGPITTATYLSIPATLPNVVVITADDLGFNDLGCYGAVSVATPNLDRLAAEGLRFTQFTTAGPGDLASQYSLLTARLPIRGSMPESAIPNQNALDSREWTLPESLRKKGYTTAFIGSWHLGDGPGSHPLDQGIQYFYGLPHSAEPPLIENRTILANPAPTDTLLDSLTGKAIEFLEGQSATQPFFLSFSPPSLPAGGNSLLGEYGNRIEALDQSVGSLLTALYEHNFTDNTLVIFLSDSGADRNTGTFPTGSNGQLRDGKTTTWEGGLRVPLIARWPSVITPAQDSRAVLWLPDLFPSLARICQTHLPTNRPLDGLDESSILLGITKEPTLEKQIFSYRFQVNKYQLATARLGPWKLHQTRLNSDPENSTTASPPLLYHLEIDPTERLRMENSEPFRIAEISSAVSDHQLTLAGEQLPDPRPAILGNPKFKIIEIPTGSKNVTLTFERPLESLDDDYLVQYSDDLDTWIDLPLSSIANRTTTPGIDSEKIQLNLPLSQFEPTTTRRFARINATRP